MASYIDLNDLGSFASINALWAAHPEGGQEGDYCTIAGVKYRWDKYDRMWVADPNFGPTPARSMTTFDGDVNMQNNLTVAGYIRAKGIKQPCVGLFASLAALEAKWPDPEVGMWALVGDSISIDTPADVYRCDTDGTWAATGGTAYIDGLEINVANGITGWVPISGTSQLPADPTPGQQGKGYLLGTMLYVYVGTGGDTLSGKYQSAQLKGIKGDKGDDAIVLPGEYSAYIADNLETDDPEKILSAKQGKRLKDEVDSISTLIGRDDVIFEKDVKYKSEYTQSTVLFESGKTYTVYVKSDIATSQTALDIYAKKSDSTRVKIGGFESVDLSTERSFSFTASENLYSIGTPYNAGGTQPTGAYFTFKWKTGETSDVIKVVDILDKGDFEIFNVTTAKNSSSAPCWVVKQLTPIMYNGMKYKIHIQASDTYQPAAWQLWVSDYNLTTSTRENVKSFENKNLSTEQTIEYTPSQDVYAIYCGYFNGTASVDITYKVDKVDDSKRLYDDENAIKELQDGWEGAGVNEFDSYYRLGAVENDTCNLITRPIGLIVMGQSNADGRIPNSSFPATATIDTTDDLTLSKQLAHCLFMKGDPESNYGEASKNFVSRNNSGLWAFDDIVYNAVNQALGGNTDFYVIKQTRGATGIRLANGSFNANVNDFVKNGYAISQLYHFKLLIERALELNPNIDFKAILWHQGEAEYQVTEEGVYYRCLCQIIYWLRGKVGNPKLPFIFGTVPTDSEQYSAVVKADMEKVAQDINDCYLVDLGAAGDMVDEYHFGATTAEKLAREMYKIMRQNSMLAPMITPIQES